MVIVAKWLRRWSVDPVSRVRSSPFTQEVTFCLEYRYRCCTIAADNTDNIGNHRMSFIQNIERVGTMTAKAGVWGSRLVFV